MRLLSADSRVMEPWANGRGHTATVERADGWRVSIAELSDAAPFSHFPGARRWLMPVTSGGVVLSVNGERRAAAIGEVVTFEGEDAAHVGELSGVTEVLNLIFERLKYAGELTHVPVADSVRLELTAETGVLVAVVTAGELAVTVGGTVAGRVGGTLGRLDAFGLDAGEAVTVSGAGALALARVSGVVASTARG